MKKMFEGFLHLNIRCSESDLPAIEKFYGNVLLEDGSQLTDRRQTLFRLHKRAGVWKIVGFLGQLPL